MKTAENKSENYYYFHCPFTSEKRERVIMALTKKAEEQISGYGKFEKSYKDRTVLSFEASLDYHVMIENSEFSLEEKSHLRKNVERVLEFFGCPFYTKILLKRDGEQVEIDVSVETDFVSGPSDAQKERYEKMNWMFKQMLFTDLEPIAKEYKMKHLFFPSEEQEDLDSLFLKVGENPELKKWQKFWECVIEKQIIELLKGDETKIKEEFSKRFPYSRY